MLLSKVAFPHLKPSTAPAPSSSGAPHIHFRRGWGNAAQTIAGTSYVELGDSKVVAYAYVPRPSTGKNVNYDEGELECKVSFASHLNKETDIYDKLNDHAIATTNEQQSKVERLISYAVLDALKPAVRLPTYPKTILGLTIVIMQSSVQDVSAAINAATLAFADAAIELRDLVTSYTVEQKLETDFISFCCTVAGMMSANDLTYVKTIGERNPQMFLATIKMTTEQCKLLREMMSDYLKQSIVSNQKSN